MDGIRMHETYKESIKKCMAISPWPRHISSDLSRMDGRLPEITRYFRLLASPSFHFGHNRGHCIMPQPIATPGKKIANYCWGRTPEFDVWLPLALSHTYPPPHTYTQTHVNIYTHAKNFIHMFWVNSPYFYLKVYLALLIQWSNKIKLFQWKIVFEKILISK